MNGEGKRSAWEKWMGLGNMLGCHQIAERSFFIRGRQFPVCARCTGMFLGYAVFGTTAWIYIPRVYISAAFMALMLLDWALQRFGIAESTNMRRLVTGILCGYGFLGTVTAAVKYAVLLLK